MFEDFLMYINQFISITWLVWLLIILYIIVRINKARKLDFSAHWHTILQDFHYYPQKFYSEIQLKFLEHAIDDVKTNNIELKQGGLFSRKRTYLRVTWKNYRYDISCTPIGKSTFISWYMSKDLHLGALLLYIIPFIGSYLVKKIYPVTYYTIDMENMFVTYAQNTVLAVVDDITENTNISLSESERKPILKDIFKR